MKKHLIIAALTAIICAVPCHARKTRTEKEAANRARKTQERKMAERKNAKRMVDNAKKRTAKAKLKRQQAALKAASRV